MLPADLPFTKELDIKKLPEVLDGSFSWLTKTPSHDEWTIDELLSDELLSDLESVIESAKEQGLTLPKEFVTFIGTPILHKHVRSDTACYLSLSESVLAFADGYLIPFLHDQQGCGSWYIYMNADGSDYCVVASFESLGTYEELKETDIFICAKSFEEFILQFWIENEISFSEDQTPPPYINPKLLELYAE